METQKFDFIFKRKNAKLNVSAVMFCKQCLAYTVHIDWCDHAIHKHSSRSQRISVLTTCTFMFCAWTHFLAFMEWVGDGGSRPAAWSYVPVQSSPCSLRVFYKTLTVGKDTY